MIEEPGPLACRDQGDRLESPGRAGTNLIKYLFRIQAFARSSVVKVDYTTTQLADKIKMLWVQDSSSERLPRTRPRMLKVTFGGEATHYIGTHRAG